MRVLLYIVLLSVISGCVCSGVDYSREFDRAQTMLRDNPAQAFELLNGYDVTRFTDSADMARWALLYGEAMAANRFAAPSDTIIDIAVNYYGGHRCDAEYQRACELKVMLADGVRHDRLASALYLQKEKEFMLYKERVGKSQLISVGLLLMLMAGGVMGWQRQRLKLNGIRTGALMAQASSLKETLSQRQTECLSLESKLSVSLANRFAMIDELCATYYETHGTKAGRNAIIDKVRSHIEALKSDSGVFSEMERCHQDVLEPLRRELPMLKPDEYRMMVYLLGGLSNRTIALLIGESMDVVYKRKSRLKAKIAASGSAARHQFLSVF